MTDSADPLTKIKQQLPNYTFVEMIYQSNKTRVYRAVDKAIQQSVVIKVMAQEYPNFTELVKFRNQYVAAKNLPMEGIIHPLSLEQCGNGYVLAMEDFGAISLEQYTQQQSVNISEFLGIAIQLAEILHKLQQHRVLHKDINPGNILIHPTTHKIWLTDFSLVSLLPKESREIQSPDSLEGTLAYIAPEQTGRMNRGIDYRTDFYGLGVTLYELLTGELPFQSDDPMELIHCHIAKVPVSPCELVPSVPQLLATLVLKLMAKNAEDRYQSALGLKHDLQQCFNQWEARGHIESFELGQEDRCDRFLIPEKLYGREPEVQTLLAAFERVSQGSSELMLVAGFSGIGKTAVVNEVHKPITQQKGYFIKGKFDQFNGNIPFIGFVQAFRSLMRQFLGESDAALANWRTKILAAVGKNGQVLIKVIPELEDIIGEQPPVPELSGSASQNRFNLIFGKFIRVFTTSEHPLVLFLDDLQWVDSASLSLLTLLMDEAHTGYLLMLGAYRNNEVDSAHPLMLSIVGLKNSLAISTLTLGAIEFDCINQLVAETLNCSEDYAHSLAQLIHRKTNGNPFFVRRLLQGIHEDNLVTFNANLRCWECNLEQLYQAVISDDVVDFIASRLRKLSQDTQDVLQLGACIGHQFDLETLSIVCQQPQKTITKHLWDALQEGLLLPIDNTYKFLQGDIQSIDLKTTRVHYRFRFLHDRVQQAAYSLIPENKRTKIHYNIGQLLIQRISQDTEEERIFELVSHLNYGVEFISSQSSRDNIAQLNLKAAQKSRQSTAYQAGLDYTKMGISLLGDNAWQRQYQTSLQLHELAAELAFICGDLDGSHYYIETVIQKAQSLLDQVNIYCLKIQIYVAQTHLQEAITTAKQLLQCLGVSLPESSTQEDNWQLVLEVEQLIGNRAISELSDLPIMTDETKIAIVRVISSVIPAAYISGSPFFPLWVVLATKISIQFGNIPVSAFIYINYSYILCHYFQAIDTGEEFGQLALQLVDDLDAKLIKPHVLIMFGLYTLHRKSYIRETLPLLNQGYVAALEVGNYEWVGYSAYAFCSNAFACSQNLVVLAQEIQSYCEGVTHLNQITSANWCQIYWQSTLNLMGQSENPAVLSGKLFQEEGFFSELGSAQDFLGLFYFHMYKLILCYLFGDNYAACTHRAEARKYLIVGGGTVGMPIFYFYDALSALQKLITLDPVSEEYSCLLQQINENQNLLQQDWANHAPMNYQHKVDLIVAEKSRLMGNNVEAMEQYDQAIAGARENKYCQEEALVNELAAKFYLSWGKQKIAAVYMQDAYNCYNHWGAKAKTDELEKHYSHLLQPILHKLHTSDPLEALASVVNPNHSSYSVLSSPSSSTSNSNTHLDFSTVLKSAQLLSEKLQFDGLLTQLVKLMLQNSGADRLAIFLPENDGSWQIRATATPETTQLLAEPLIRQSDLPIQLIQYVKNTQEIIVIDDIGTELPVIDTYLQNHQPYSVLCIPLLYQGNLTGLLYLQNQVVAGVFNRDRITILNFLCTQAAISLKNAQLYEQSQTNAQQLEHSLSQLQVNETRFRNMAANIPGVIYQLCIAPDGVTSVLYVSPDCDALYGVTAGAMMAGQYSFRDFVHQEDYPIIEQSVAESAQLLQTFDKTFRIVTRSGELKWIHATSRPSKQPDGSTIWDGVLMDVSDQKVAEQKLILKQNHLEALLNNIPHMAWVKDSESRFIAVNKSLAQLLNCTPTDMIGKTDYDFSPAEIARGYQEDDFQVLASGQRKVVEERVRRGDDTWGWLETTKTPFFNAQGQFAGTVGIAADITDRKQAERLLTEYNHELEKQVEERTQALQKSEATLLKAQQVAHVGNWEFDIASQTVNWSPEMFRIHGLKPKSSAPSYPEFLQMIPVEARQQLHQYVERAISKGTPYTIEYSRAQADGSVSYHECRAEVERDAQGKIIRLLGTTLDITNLKQAELALQNLVVGTAATTGEDFFPALVQHIATALNASHAFVTEVMDGGSRLHFLAAWADGKPLPNDTVDADGTTCAVALREGAYYCERNVIACFPQNPRLAPMGVESYMGVALKDQEGQAIGTLCIFARHTIVDPEHSQQILRVFGARAAAEIERQRGQAALEQLNVELEQRVEQRTQELARSEQDLRTIFNNVYDGIMIHDLDGTILDVNHRYVEMLGGTREEILASSIADFTASDAPIEKIPEITQQVASGKELRFEWQDRRLDDGTTFDVDVSLKKLMLGNRPVIIASARDISDSKAAKESLRKSEAKFRTLISNLDSVVYRCQNDVTRTMEFMSDAIETLSGYPASDFINNRNRTYASIIHPDDKALVNQAVAQGLNHLQSFSMEYRIIDRDDSICWVTEKGKGIFDKNAHLMYLEGVIVDISDRKRTEAALKLSEARANAAFEQAAVGIAESNLTDGKITRTNNYFCQMTGYTVQELKLLTGADLTHPNDLSDSRHKIQQLYAGEIDSFIVEKRYIRKDKSYFWATTAVTLIQNPEEESPRCLAVIQDISDRKATELALQDSQAQFRHMTENIPGMIFRCVLHPDGTDEITYISSQVREIFELEPEAVLEDGGRQTWERTHPDDIPKIEADVQLSAKTLQPFRNEHRLILPQKGLRWIQAIARPEQLSNGDIVWDGVAMDISDRKQSEAEQQRHLTIIESTSDFIGTSDPNGKILYLNEAWRQLLQRNTGETAYRTSISEQHPPWALEIIINEALPTAEQQGIWSGETALLDGNEQEIPVSQVVIAHKSNNGEVEYFSTIIRDTSERKQAEAQLRQTNQELANATRLKDEFLANMSHEFRTPLNAILGMTEGLQEEVFGQINNKQLKALQTIERSGAHLLELINDILDLAKIDSGHIELEYSPVVVKHLCQSSLVFIKQQSLKKGIHLDLKLPLNLPDINIDERRIRQVLINLLNNAVKFTPEDGYITLEVLPLLRDSTRHQNFLSFAVQDTGIGIAPEDLKKLFQPFVQIDSSLNRQYEGTGLGLALVKKLVELHGGQVTVTSEVGVGSCFTVELPYSDVSITNSISSTTEFIPVIPNIKQRTITPLILLVEDNDANISTLSSYLRAKGYGVQVAKNGQTALELAQTEPPDVILIDIQMPGMDGIAVIEKIRQLPALAKIPIIALTALSLEGDRERCLAAGANMYLSKPVKLKQLVTELQNLSTW